MLTDETPESLGHRIELSVLRGCVSKLEKTPGAPSTV